MDIDAGRNLIQDRLDRRARKRDLVRSLLPFSGLLFICLFFIATTQGRILAVTNLANLATQSFTVSLVAVGAAFVYAHGGMDFSIGGSCGLAQLVCALLVVRGAPLWIAVSTCILTAVACSTLVGGTAIVFRVPVFVASLCMRAICTGLLVTGVASSSIPIDYVRFSRFNDVGLKLIVLAVAVTVGYYLFEHTALGKQERAMGGNILTAIQAGIRVRGASMAAYVLMGLCVGIAAFFQMTRAGMVTGSSGSGLEFDIMVAIVLGGFPMMGGSAARLRAVLIGALTTTILSNGLVLWGLDFYLVNGIKGLLFLAIVGISYDRTNQNQVALSGS